VSTVIGIDLGTTNSCVAVFRDEQAEVLKNVDDDLTTPSVVTLDTKSNEFIVGKMAINREEAFPGDTIRAVKRLMGKSYAQVMREHIHHGMNYNIVADENGRACIEIQGKKHSPEEISAAILAYLKKSAEQQLDEPITQAVITIPAYFDETQRQATINAGKIAGLNVRKLINEPAAAALTYALENSHKIQGMETIAVYDLGGGTFDITLAQTQTDREGYGNYTDLSVLSHAGNNHLGGVDIDNKIVRLCKEAFRIINNYAIESVVDNAELANVESKLRAKAEEIKKSLSKREIVEVIIPALCVYKHQPITLEFELTREVLEKYIEELIDETLVCCQHALDAANLNKHRIDHLFLIGGMVRMPLVQQKVEAFFGRTPRKILNPDEVVAMGAAIAGSMIKEKALTVRGTSTVVQINDVTAKDLGVEADKEGTMSVILSRSENLPCTGKRLYSTDEDNQTAVKIKIYQGNETKAKHNTLLGEFELQGIPPMRAGQPRIEVIFDLNEDNTLTVSAREMSMNKSENLTISVPKEKLPDKEINHLKKILKIRE